MPLRDPYEDSDKPAKIYTQDVNNWQAGVVTELSAGRTPIGGLRAVKNMTLEEDGMLRRRPSLTPLGDGILAEGARTLKSNVISMPYKGHTLLVYVTDDPNLEVGVRGGFTGKYRLQIRVNGWTPINGHTLFYWSKPPEHELPLTHPDYVYERFTIYGFGNHIVILGYDGYGIRNHWRIIAVTDAWASIAGNGDRQYSVRGNNATPEYHRSGQIADIGYYPLYYPFDTNAEEVLIVADYRYAFTYETNYGETSGGYSAPRGAPLIREEWWRQRDPVSHYMQINLNYQRVSRELAKDNNTKINIYMSVNGGDFLQIASDVVTDHTRRAGAWGRASRNYFRWRDDGTNPQTLKRLPISNGTDLPNAHHGVHFANRTFVWGFEAGRGADVNRVYFSSPAEPFNFSTTQTSGFFDVSSNNEELVTSITPGQDTVLGRGLIIITRYRNKGGGNKYFGRPITRTFGGIVYESYKTELIDDNGSPALDGVVTYNENLFYPSIEGFKVHGTRPKLQNFIGTEDISQTIRAEALKLNYDQLAKIVGCRFQNKIYWSIPYLSETNNRLWCLDLTQGQGSWMTNWQINTDYICTSLDAEGREIMILVDGTKISKLTKDNSERFGWFAEMGRLFHPYRKTNLMSMIAAYFIVYNLVGAVRLSVYGRSESGYRVLFGTKVIKDSDQAQSGAWGRWEQGESEFEKSYLDTLPPERFETIHVNMPFSRKALWLYPRIENVSPNADCIWGFFSYRFTDGGASNLDSDIA